MDKNRANSSVVAILVLLLVIAGVLYLFWQNQQATVEPTDETTVEVGEDTPSMEVPALEADITVEEMVVNEEPVVVTE